MSRPYICGFLKVRNEIIREGNLYRVLENMRQYCDRIVACDDASTDGTREHLLAVLPKDDVILVPPEKHQFHHELRWKQAMLDRVDEIQPTWIMWMDADEELDRPDEFVEWCRTQGEAIPAWRFHYTQFWRTRSWARTDDGFDNGSFTKLWRWSPDLSFRIEDRTHASQFPQQFVDQPVGRAPFEVWHWGNYGKNLIWKCLQYHGGYGNVDRHLLFEGATYRHTGYGSDPEPQPFTAAEVAHIVRMQNLRGLTRTFTIIVPTYNRAADLPRTLTSVLQQSYDRWVCIVIDDGSTDETPSLMREWQDKDPRIFYVRFPENRGGVAVNEVGMDLACDISDWWTRLGSDDVFLPHKLEVDARALDDHQAIYGPFVTVRDGKVVVDAGLSNPPATPKDTMRRFLSGQFAASWANCAVQTSVLRRIKQRYGNYVDPRLRNMEDFLFNARVAREVPWVWRGTANGIFYIDPQPSTIDLLIHHPTNWTIDAMWTSATNGASGNYDLTQRDNELTLRLIQEMLREDRLAVTSD